MHTPIEGSDVGAVRYCEFSTGDFVEPFMTWEPPSGLAIDVARQPVPMREWSFYASVHTPRLDHNFRCLHGEFRLSPREGGGHDSKAVRGTDWTWRRPPTGEGERRLHRIGSTDASCGM